jgi:hypothetical protein
MKHLDGHYRVKHLVYLAIMASEGGRDTLQPLSRLPVDVIVYVHESGHASRFRVPSESTQGPLLDGP